jgi:parallel beta-helix repeat protein
VRGRKIIVFLLVFMLFVISSTSQIPMKHHIDSPQNLSIPSQTTTPITIVGNIELSQRSTGGVGTRSEPYLISSQSIISSGYYCISVQNTTAFFTVRNCDLKSAMTGSSSILFNNVENGMVENCLVRGGSGGASLSNCTDCIIKESTFFDCTAGISITRSDNCTILDCNAYVNEWGIQINSSNGSLVTNSSIYSNSNFGVRIDAYSDGTMIYRNNIGWNGLNAYNDGENTEFTNGINIGNAWSDYNDSEVYEVPGFYPTTDSFASLLTDTESPIINSPFDKVFDVESNGETLTWAASDDFVFSYVLRINDVPQNAELWDGREITISLDSLPAGSHTLVMTVRDAAGNNASDEVIVTAVSFMFGGLGTELVIWGSVVTVAFFILIVIIIKKMP